MEILILVRFAGFTQIKHVKDFTVADSAILCSLSALQSDWHGEKSCILQASSSNAVCCTS